MRAAIELVFGSLKSYGLFPEPDKLLRIVGLSTPAPPVADVVAGVDSPIIFILELLCKTSLLSCLLRPIDSLTPFFGFFVNIRERKSVSSYLLKPGPDIVPG